MTDTGRSATRHQVVDGHAWRRPPRHWRRGSPKSIVAHKVDIMGLCTDLGRCGAGATFDVGPCVFLLKIPVGLRPAQACAKRFRRFCAHFSGCGWTGAFRKTAPWGSSGVMSGQRRVSRCAIFGSQMAVSMWCKLAIFPVVVSDSWATSEYYSRVAPMKNLSPGSPHSAWTGALRKRIRFAKGGHSLTTGENLLDRTRGRKYLH